MLDSGCMWRRAALCIFVAVLGNGCSRRHPTSDPTPAMASPDSGLPPNPSSPPAAVDTAARLCEEQNGTPRFRRCPHWRMLSPKGCAAHELPQAFSPCACMCDLCAEDRDCSLHIGGRCIRFTATTVDEVQPYYQQSTCVYPGSDCYPPTKCRRGMTCVNRGGEAACERDEQGHPPSRHP